VVKDREYAVFTLIGGLNYEATVDNIKHFKALVPIAVGLLVFFFVVRLRRNPTA
jgi:hypothetical protein